MPGFRAEQPKPDALEGYSQGGALNGRGFSADIDSPSSSRVPGPLNPPLIESGLVGGSEGGGSVGSVRRPALLNNSDFASFRWDPRRGLRLWGFRLIIEPRPLCLASFRSMDDQIGNTDFCKSFSIENVTNRSITLLGERVPIVRNWDDEGSSEAPRSVLLRCNYSVRWSQSLWFPPSPSPLAP